MKTITVYKREALFMRREELGNAQAKKLLKRYVFSFYEEKACAKCEFLSEKGNGPDGVSDICANCAAFHGSHHLAAQVKIKDVPYIRTPIGDHQSLINYLGAEGFKVQVKSKNPDHPIKPFKFTGTLRPEQVEAVEAMATKKRGILKSPPRSGKTVMFAALVAKLAQKTIIIASQRDWLVGFLETFVGSATQKPLTDIDPKRIGFAKKLEDFERLDICLCTIQTFYSEGGQQLLRKIRDMFGMVGYDESQTTAATKYARISARLNVTYALALSGTPARKDEKHVLSNMLIGPIVHKVFVERMKPMVRIVRTDYRKNFSGQTRWTTMVASLEKDKKRLKLIAEWALEDMANGHLVLIPLSQIKPIQLLVEEINRQAGRSVAYPFYGGLKKDVRDSTIQRARKYKIKIIVGNIKLLSTGINIPRASCLYEVAMSSNLPNVEQRVSRILTVWADKPQPLIRFFLDDLQVRKSCLANEWHRCIKPKFKPMISERDEIALESYLKKKSDHGYYGML